METQARKLEYIRRCGFSVPQDASDRTIERYYEAAKTLGYERRAKWAVAAMIFFALLAIAFEVAHML